MSRYPKQKSLVNVIIYSIKLKAKFAMEKQYEDNRQ